MFSLTEVTINTCVECLQAGYRRTYGDLKPDYADAIAKVAKIALHNIATSDALYHDVEHTILVALVGQEILRGKQIRYGNVSCQEWSQVIISLLCHDIGYVKGACRQDKTQERLFDKGINGEIVSLPFGATDASLTPYHVDRSKLFVAENLPERELIDVETIRQYIELTRFPVPKSPEHQDTVDYPGLVRAADLIGQLSDPRYLEKMPALFYEFEETGTNKCLGYRHPADLRAGYPNFFWNVVYQYIEESLQHLQVTEEGQKIIKNLYNNVAIVELENKARHEKLKVESSDKHTLKGLPKYHHSHQPKKIDESDRTSSTKLTDIQVLDLSRKRIIMLESKAGLCFSSHD